MADATATAEAATALKYLEHMDGHLRARQPEITLWEQYFEGFHRMQFATSRFRATFGNLFREFADNWCALVVNASVERLHVDGFRADSGDDVVKNVMEIWRDNYLDSDSRIAHTEAVKLGESYLLVDPDGNKAGDTESPLITIEHPSQAIVMKDPTNMRRRLAGLKEWTDPTTGRVNATVYTPKWTFRYQATEKGHEEHSSLSPSGLAYPTDYMNSPSSQVGATEARWEARDGVEFATENRLKRVSLIPFRNNPTLKTGGTSDLAVVIPIQDAINKLVSDMIIASEFASFAQRWATGIEIPKDARTGQPINTEAFLASAGRIWASEDENAKFGQFEASDLGNYVKAIEMLIQHLAALTRTPPHYLLGQSGNFPSGDSLTATETGLTAKTTAKTVDFGPTWEEGMFLGQQAKGTASPQTVHALWRDPEQRIRSQRIDGAVKMSTLGVPQDVLWREMGFTPEEIERMHEEKKKMGQDPNSTEFGVRPAELEKGEGPEGNLKQQTAATQAARVARQA